MRKAKEQNITVTHTEILSYAIKSVIEMWEKEKAQAKRYEEADPDFSKEILEGSMWKQKLKVLLQLYKIETGNDYGYDLDLD